MTYEFPIVAPGNAPHGMFAGVCVVLLIMLTFFAFLAFGIGRERFQISSDGLKISAFLYGRSIPARDLDVARAQAVDLSANPDYRLTMRTNGTGLPGYQAGWFHTANAGKALAFVTDKRRVVCIPTRQDYTVLLSVENPQEFLQALRSAIR
jgi:hypothetical protein